jgi:hypothetical protein
MPENVFEIIFADSKWWFRSPSREISFPSKTEAIEAALRAARFQNEVLLRIHRETGSVEGELTLTPGRASAVPSSSDMKPRKEVDRTTARSIRFYSSQPIQFVSRRIEELDQEIPLETFVYRGGAALTIASLTLLRLRGKTNAAWILACVIAALQLQYSYQGRNRLTDLLRKRGYRSRKEIQAEKFSLEALRGDFAAFTALTDPIERARKCLDIFL